jgi:hypothetical protein
VSIAAAISAATVNGLRSASQLRRCDGTDAPPVTPLLGAPAPTGPDPVGGAPAPADTSDRPAPAPRTGVRPADNDDVCQGIKRLRCGPPRDAGLTSRRPQPSIHAARQLGIRGFPGCGQVVRAASTTRYSGARRPWEPKQDDSRRSARFSAPELMKPRKNDPKTDRPNTVQITPTSARHQRSAKRTDP